MSDSTKSSSGSVFLVWLTVFLGWSVTALDLQIVSFVQEPMAASLHVSTGSIGNAFFLYAVGLGLGALVLGYFSDVFIGRKRAFLYGILGTVIMTGLTGFVHNIPELLVVRFLAGLFSGGEWALGLAMLSEFAPVKRRSLLLAGTQAGVGVGFGLANVFAQTFASPTALGWRWAYFASFGFAALSYLVRLRLHESPAWTKIASVRDRAAGEVTQGLRALFTKKQLRYTIIALAVAFLIGAPQGAWDFSYPAWYAHGGITGQPIPSVSGDTITYAYEVALVVSTVFGGWFMDKVSAKWLLPFVWIAVPFTLLIWRAPFDQGALPVASYLFIAGFFRQLGWSVTAAYFVVLFPTRIRGVGMGLAVVAEWMLGYGASAYWGPSLVSAGNWNLFWLLQVILLALIPIPMVIAGVETKGRRLDFQEDDDSPLAASAASAASVGDGLGGEKIARA
ncbi:MFS transporter [Mycobacterium sp. 3519A]|uniref:MFS transporter n=1 Tax=Mycobacterium sp. 3519A TaxID=2057184 RepID=UPI0013596EED|nr:MFS transporter [Mycobacterium sp. 3519A]